MLPCYYQDGFNQKLPLKLAAKNDMPLQTPNGDNDYCKFSVFPSLQLLIKNYIMTLWGVRGTFSSHSSYFSRRGGINIGVKVQAERTSLFSTP